MRDGFERNVGVVLAAVGSAVGVGNIWKFPYITGVHGGSAFVIVYLLCILFIGMPLLLAAFVLGRKSGKDPVGAFKSLAPNMLWVGNGWLAVAGSFLIITFYSVVAGWAVYYAYLSAAGELGGLSPQEVGGTFGEFTASIWKPVLWQVVFMLATAYIVLKGVAGGIEKYSRLLMPLLFVLLLALDIRSITLDGAGEGLDYLFSPDFSKLSFGGVLAALGHAFFTLSIGGGTMITYGSYIKKESNLMPMVVQVAFADTVVALLAGIAIFPAVFAFGVEPTSGPGLVFVTLPNIFNMMPLGQLFSFVFFVLLFIAALTSAISLIEPSVAYLMTERNWSRRRAVKAVCIAATLLGAVFSQGNGILKEYPLAFYIDGVWERLDIFSWVITLSDQMLPVCGFFIAIFVGWVMDKSIVENELSSGGRHDIWYYPLFRFALCFIAPLAIIMIFLSSILGNF